MVSKFAQEDITRCHGAVYGEDKIGQIELFSFAKRPTFSSLWNQRHFWQRHFLASFSSTAAQEAIITMQSNEQISVDNQVVTQTMQQFTTF